MTQPSLLDVEKRSFKLNGKATSIELEKVYWRLLDNMEKSKGATWEKIATAMIQACPDGVPRARCVRVWCVIQLLKAVKRNDGQVTAPG